MGYDVARAISFGCGYGYELTCGVGSLDVYATIRTLQDIRGSPKQQVTRTWCIGSSGSQSAGTDKPEALIRVANDSEPGPATPGAAALVRTGTVVDLEGREQEASSRRGDKQG